MNEHLNAFALSFNSLPLGQGKVPQETHDSILESIGKTRKAIDKVRRGKETGPPAEDDLSLSWIHGFASSGDNRSNVKYTADNKIAYYAAGLGVVLDPEAKTQKFVYGHTDDVTAMAIHPDGNIVATGQLGKTPLVVVWDVATGAAIQTISGFFKRGVLRLDFSSDGTTLIGVGSDDDHSIALYDWKR